jgi:hypothetical protein
MTTYTHIACAPTKFLCALPTLRTPRASLLCLCTPHNAKFRAHSYTPTFFRAEPKFSAHPRTLTFFCVTPKFNAHTCTLTFFRATPKLSVRISTPIPCSAMSNFTYHKIFTAYHAYLVCPPVHIHFYAHQILVNSTIEIGAFA